MRGYFGVGIHHPKREVNIGTLWRSAYQLGATYIYTIGRRYSPQSSNTTKSERHIPLFDYSDFDDFYDHLPYDCPIIAVEMGEYPLENFIHPERCVYLLGAEDYGLPQEILGKCYCAVSLRSVRQESYNVSVAGSIVMYDRMVKNARERERTSR